MSKPTIMQFGDHAPRDWREHTPLPTESDDDYSEDGTPSDRDFAASSLGFDPNDEADAFSKSVKDAAHAPAGSPQGGQFVSQGGSGGDSEGEHGASGHKVSLLELPVHLEHAVMGAVKKGAVAALGYVKEIATGKMTPEGIPEGAEALVKSHGIATSIGHGVGIVAKGGVKLYMASWIAGNKAVELVARAKDLELKGLSESEVNKVKGLCAGYDILAAKPMFLALEHLGLPHMAAASTLIPAASVGYLAYSAATNPIAVAKAAGAAVKAISSKVGSLFKKPAKAFDPAETNDAVGILCDAAKKHKDDDAFFAVLPLCIEYSGEHGGGISEAIEMAEMAMKEMPAPKDES